MLNSWSSMIARSSPRTRGYFRTHGHISPIRFLFPAHAGVFLILTARSQSTRSLPRARGGISGSDLAQFTPNDSSPRTRGYFRGDAARPPHSRLFPAHAGVFPWCPQWWKHAEALPRARGGISDRCDPKEDFGNSSPRTRGYFRGAPSGGSTPKLFPAHAGVFPHGQVDGGSH